VSAFIPLPTLSEYRSLCQRSEEDMRHLSGKIVLVVTAIAVAVIPAAAQAPPAKKPSFEVASVKPGDPYDGRIGIRLQPGGRFSTSNTPLKMLIDFAYDANNQVMGGPEWINSATFNIEAKADSATPFPSGPDGPEQTRLMLQTLLAERFKLFVHWQTTEGPVYELGIAKGGSKLKEADTTNTPRMQVALGHFVGTAASMPVLVRNLSQRLGRPVIDKTGLEGKYNFELTWTPDPGQIGTTGQQPGPAAAPLPDTNGPSMFSALEEQLGLKLTSTKGPIRKLVIDSVQKPAEN
jgi:uncharacterized protein (TIGR03435 family)